MDSVSKENPSEFQTARKYFDYLFTYSIQFGMPVVDYWHDSDPTLYYAYKKAFYNGVKTQREAINFQSWLAGSYIKTAVLDVVGGALSKDYESSYPETPIDFDELERVSLLTDEEREQEELIKMLAFEEQMRIENSERLKRVLNGKDGE